MRARALDILKRLIAFDTVSSESNLALIDYIRELLASKGIESLIVKDESGRKANLFASVGPRDVPAYAKSYPLFRRLYEQTRDIMRDLQD